jgi:hypothetical protein
MGRRTREAARDDRVSRGRSGIGPLPGRAREASGQDFWLVLPMYFTDRHITEDGTEYRDCFVDFDGVIRMPYGRLSAESVTHWAYLPLLPGMTVHSTLGEDAQTALRNALG